MNNFKHLEYLENNLAYVKYFCKCYCKKSFLEFKMGKSYYAYIEYCDNDYWVVYNFDGQMQNIGYRFGQYNGRSEFSPAFSDIFYTEKEYRKLKLNKLNESR